MLSAPIVVGTWIIFFVVWVASAFSVKPSVHNRQLYTGIWIRLGIFAAVVLALHFGLVSRSELVSFVFNSPQSPLVHAIGAMLCVLGLAFAIWSRFTLGRNWGTPMTQRAEPELVTAGPYHYVRHPIYTSMILMIIGTALAISYAWFVVLVIAGAYLIFSATREEKFLLAQFPTQYPEYKKHSKMLIPFVF